MPTAHTFQKAEKKRLYGRVALCGPTGSGKTWTALTWATVLGKRIALVDTENRSAAYYANRFTFDVADWPPPYDAVSLTDLIRNVGAAGEHDVLIIDSLSHFWNGQGGILDLVDAAAQRSRGNSYAGWKVGTPALANLIDTMRNAPMHVIVCMRSKMEYTLEERNGKSVPVKVGLAPVMREGVEYEFTVVGDLNLEHQLVISKSRCDLIADKVAQPHRADELAQTFADWLSEGDSDDRAEPHDPAPVADPTPKTDRQEWQDSIIGPRLTTGQVAIKGVLDKINDTDRVRIKAEFIEAFGPLGKVTAKDQQAALDWARARLTEDMANHLPPAQEPEQTELIPDTEAAS